jgi:ParB/RepB/Spo0J family partition protein
MKENSAAAKTNEEVDLTLLPKTGDASVFNIIHELPIAKIDIDNQVRKDFNLDSLNELAQSIKENGLIQPITVRKIFHEDAGKDERPYLYKLVTGERRLRATKLLKADTIRAIIQDFFTTGEILQVQIIENLQREGLHPMEEAWGYSQLIEVNKLTRKNIAEKIGKSLSYIDKRVQLMKLYPEAQKLFRENRLTVSHAIEIARLDEDLQKEVLKRIYRSCDNSYQDIDTTRDIIKNEFMTDLSSAVFDLKDSLLVKQAGACNGCFKNTSCYETLFDDLATKGKAFCTDKACFNNKTKTFQRNKITAAMDKGMVKISPDGGGKSPDILYSGSYTVIPGGEKKCDAAKEAVVIKSGYDYNKHNEAAREFKIGQTKTICADPKCKIHHNEVNKPTASTDKGKDVEKEFNKFGKKLVDSLSVERFNLNCLASISRQITELNFVKFYDLIIAALYNTLNYGQQDVIQKLWGMNEKRIVNFSFELSKTYEKLKALKLTNKVEKITHLLFIQDLDPDAYGYSNLLLKFVEDNFKAIKIPDIRKKTAAEIESIKITDYKAEIKKCKAEKDFIEVAKKHLVEVSDVLKSSGLEKFPPYDNKPTWDGKKIVEDIYSLSTQKLLNLVDAVADKNIEAALKLHRLFVMIPEIKKCLAGNK